MARTERWVSLRKSEYEKMKHQNELMRDWIKSESERTDICTYALLGEICEHCRCGRKEKENYSI